MTWVKIDDRTIQHPKTSGGTLEALGLWLAGLVYCNSLNNGGTIPKDQLRVVFPGMKAKTRTLNRCARELVELGRWHDRGDHWEVHGYAVEQKHALPNEVAKRREADAKRQREHRERNANETGNECEPDENRTRSEREPDEKLTGNAQEPNENELAAASDSEALGDMSRCDPRGRAREPGPARPGQNQTKPTPPVGAGAGRELTPEEAELVALVRTDKRLGQLLPDPRPIVEDAVGLLLTAGVTLDGLKRSVAAASASVGKKQAAGDPPDGSRAAGILEWAFRDTSKRERKERDRAHEDVTEDPDAERQARLKREAEERAAQRAAEASALPPGESARRAREAIAGIGNGGRPTPSSKSGGADAPGPAKAPAGGTRRRVS